MKARFLPFILVSIFIVPIVSSLKAQVNQRDSLALVALYDTLGGGGGFRFHTGWKQGPVSTWNGVTLSNDRVVGIQLAYDNTHGHLPLSLGNLDSLISLDISHESIGLEGPIPSTIGNLKKLRYLHLDDNYLSDSIPSSIGNLESLEVLSLNTNTLTGGIPSSIGNLQNLTSLDLSHNTYLSGLGGSIPSSIGNLKNITSIELSYDNLSGSIPPSLGNCTALTFLDVSNNKLSDNFPSALGNSTALTFLNVINNQLSGNFPSSFKKLTHLTTLYAGGNRLSGGLANIFVAGSALTDLEIGGNSFSGPIPASISNLQQLKTLGLMNDNFSGLIPINSILQLQQLVGLDLSHNQLTGHIPGNLSTLPLLEGLDLSYNNLTGKIPSALGNTPALRSLVLSHNNLTGTIPASFGKAKLQSLDVSYNQLAGDVSAFLNPSLAYYPEHLYINNNQLYCSTNPQFTQLRKKGYELYAQNNQFTFNGLEFLQEKYNNGFDYNVILDSQATLPIHINNNTLSVSAGGTLSNLTFVWHKTGTNKTVTVKGDSTFQPPVNGNYYAVVSDSIITNLYSDTKLYTDTVTYTKNSLVSSTTDLKITISPNPVRGMIQIHGLNDKINSKITLADVGGYVWMTTMARNQNYIQLDVSRLKPGNYLINVNDEKGGIKTIQFVKE